ncbi:hypothetical protein CRG98_016060 [Punica granatum]|uniref:At1g61320/AtMIF1 LRR domain-containing protein n=1 Tax=Punica granatum TaxID=22663 RepID=A0A2I0K4S6_PUNGR|nr:hypothetical protein CRG98_016060 [Punica granatum]
MDDDDDKISTLPEPMKHHILSFLPSIKEVARTSSLSESWLQTWRSFQITDFEQWLVLPRYEILYRGSEYNDPCVRFVDSALMRSRHGMPRFRLIVTLDMAPHIDRWLGTALDYHVQELSLNITSNGMDLFDDDLPALPYLIPGKVLSCEFIKSLTLDSPVKIDRISSVSLPSLRSLHLLYSLIDNQMFRTLLGGCPLLEGLSVISCSPLSELKVSNLNYLKRVTVVSCNDPEINAVSIQSPSLESFSLKSEYGCDKDIGLVVNVSSSLRYLEITNLDKTDDWLRQFLSKFPLLESLTLKGCRLLQRIKISNPLLKKMSIKNCGLVDIRIDAPKLSSFYYETRRTLPSVWTENPPYSSVVGLGFRYYFAEDPSSLCFEELRESFTRWSAIFGCLESTVLFYEFPVVALLLIVMILKMDEGMKDGMNEKLALSAPGIICEVLASREENPKGCPCEVKCWKHELKDAKIDRVEGIQHRGPLDWHSLFNLLPTLLASNEVRFRLQW